MPTLNPAEAAISAARARLCLTCGKCTGVCPLSRMGADYSPRRFVEQIVTGSNSPVDDLSVWDCLEAVFDQSSSLRLCRACGTAVPTGFRRSASIVAPFSGGTQ